MSLLHQLRPHDEPAKPVSKPKLTKPTPVSSKQLTSNICPKCGRPLKKTRAERAAYMLGYMRKRRAKLKEAKE